MTPSTTSTTLATALLAGLMGLLPVGNQAAAQHKHVSEKTTRAEKPQPSRALPSTRRVIAAFASAPFPYEGEIPHTGKPFLNVVADSRVGHQARSGTVHWADQTYNDNRVLLSLPKGFRADRPGVIVFFMHGHMATLERDVIARQRVAEQVETSGLNVALVAPQFAYDARDSSPGRLWQPGAFTALMNEAAVQLARLARAPNNAKAIARMPIVLVAYSGGYLPLAHILDHGGENSRIKGVVVLDGAYGEIERFSAWIMRNREAFFLSATTASSEAGNKELAAQLAERGVATQTTLAAQLKPGSVSLLQIPPTISHADVVTDAWTHDPIRDVLRRLGGPRLPKSKS